MNKKTAHCWQDCMKICRLQFRDIRWHDKYTHPPPSFNGEQNRVQKEDFIGDDKALPKT